MVSSSSPRGTRHRRRSYYRDLAESLLTSDLSELGCSGPELCEEEEAALGSLLQRSTWRGPDKARRERVVRIFESAAFQKLVVFLTLVDVVALSTELQFPGVAIVAWLVHLVSRSLLVVFVAELGALL